MRKRSPGSSSVTSPTWPAAQLVLLGGAPAVLDAVVESWRVQRRTDSTDKSKSVATVAKVRSLHDSPLTGMSTSGDETRTRPELRRRPP